MNKLIVGLLLLPLGQGVAFAQTGDAQAGKAFWEGVNSQCRNCHGEKGEGAFGPDLAGRKLTVAQFAHAIRKPWGIMPAYIESQVTDAEVANMVAYFNSLPANASRANGVSRCRPKPRAGRWSRLTSVAGSAMVRS